MWGGCFGTLLIVACVAIGAMIAWNISESRSATNWPHVSGTLVHADVAEVTRGFTTEYECKVEYRYRVKGTSYRGTRLQIGNHSYATRDAAEEVLKPLAPGQPVTVYYQSTDPAISVLRPGTELAQYDVFRFLALLTLVGVGLLGTAIVNLFYRGPPAQVTIEARDSDRPDPFGDPMMSSESAWRLKCDGCGKVLSVPTSLAGRKVKCPKCAQVFSVPDAKPSDLDPPRPPAPNRGPSRSTASDPGNVSLSREKLEVLYPNFFAFSGLLMRLWKSLSGSAPFSASTIEKHLQFGDSRAAVVISVSPLLVAAYSDERDCVVMLKFPEDLVATYRLKPGSKLITVNTYMKGPKRPVADLIEGPLSRGNWHNVIPMIADFLSDDRRLPAKRCTTRAPFIPHLGPAHAGSDNI